MITRDEMALLPKAMRDVVAGVAASTGNDPYTVAMATLAWEQIKRLSKPERMKAAGIVINLVLLQAKDEAR